MKRGNVSIAISIIVAGLLIAGAVLFSGNKKGENLAAVADDKVAPEENASLGAINPITESDHIRGNVNAPIKIVEYSDVDCPYCSRFHNTMKAALEQYGDQVAWVYRHFPLTQIHPNAEYIAQVSECVAKEGGNDAFWSFLDLAFDDQTARGARADKSVIIGYVNQIGVNSENVKACADNKEFDQKIKNDIKNAMETGGNGTPWSIVIGPDNKMIPINGALPLDSIKTVIDELLK